MLNIRKSFICLAAVLSFAAVSCQLDDTLYYNNLTMGNVVNGKFLSDQGNIFNIVDQNCPGILTNEKRAIVLCDVLNETEGAQNEYDVKLTQFAPVLEKAAVESAQASEGEIAVNDPIHIEELWFSGGYINMQIRSLVKKENSQKHLINLVYTKTEDGKYTLNLRHNAYGEVYTEETASQLEFSGSGYVSFPITFVEGDEATFTFTWKDYKSPGVGLNFAEAEDKSFEYKWKREGFQQVPNVVTLTASQILR